MVHVLDSRIPRVWRTPDSIQFGVDDPVLVLEGVTHAEERMLVALSGGVTPEGLQLIASRAGAPDGSADALLDRVAPALASPSPVPAPSLVVLDGAGPTAAALERMLTEAGVEVRSGLEWSDPAVERADAAVVVASYAVEPHRHVRWLRRDVAHLPVVFGDTGVTVGPLVLPGRGPCLRCLDLHRTDADAAWPAMATQLHTRPAHGETAIAAGATAARAAALLTTYLRAGRAVPGASARLPSGGADWVSRTWRPHPECGCLGLPP
ncbi:hypothetical protein [Leifsonia sp. SIMBA_070]|uniref:hypothetical protein n=1 Tax=Leifsonia sp. SIMBA_070 TaxID=3085810 RepID=UPI003978F138